MVKGEQNTMRTTLQAVIEIERYASEIYWPELCDKIDIEKKSGMNRQKSEEKRDQALSAYLQREGITADEYETICQKAMRPFRRVNDDDQKSEIVIPENHISACLVQTIRTTPKSVRQKFQS